MIKTTWHRISKKMNSHGGKLLAKTRVGSRMVIFGIGGAGMPLLNAGCSEPNNAARVVITWDAPSDQDQVTGYKFFAGPTQEDTTVELAQVQSDSLNVAAPRLALLLSQVLRLRDDWNGQLCVRLQASNAAAASPLSDTT